MCDHPCPDHHFHAAQMNDLEVTSKQEGRQEPTHKGQVGTHFSTHTCEVTKQPG